MFSGVHKIGTNFIKCFNLQWEEVDFWYSIFLKSKMANGRHLWVIGAIISKPKHDFHVLSQYAKFDVRSS